MSATVPPYDILGLAPGAGQAEIESAYRRLIKQYHPDHAGGDGARAAEINRAYSLLKDPAARARLDGGGEGAAAPGTRQSAGWRAADGSASVGEPRGAGPRLVLGAAIGITLLVIVSADGRAGWWLDEQWQQLKGDFARALAIEPEPGFAPSAVDSAAPAPIDLEAIRAGQRQAAIVVARSGARAAGEASRSCYRAYRRSLRSALLDHCLAFDQAAAARLLVEDRQPARYFEPLAITARQIAAAQLLSRDYRWIEDRLDQVRAHVERIADRQHWPIATPVVRPIDE